MTAPKPPPEPPPHQHQDSDGSTTAPDRWLANCTPQITKLSTTWKDFVDDWIDDSLHDQPYPPGSLMDPTRPPSPTSPMDFPPPSYIATFCPPPQTSKVDTPFSDILDILTCDTVSRITCQARTVGLDGTDPTIFCTHSSQDMMADTGTNCGVTGNREVLTNIRPITPIDITLALTPNSQQDTPNTRCTEMGDLPITDIKGDVLFIPMLIHNGATDTIISPQGVLHSDPWLYSFQLEGFRDESHGSLRFYSRSERLIIDLALTKRNGLYYSLIDSTLVDSTPHFTTSSTPSTTPTLAHKLAKDTTMHATLRPRHIESELWAARLGHCGKYQLDNLPRCADGIPDHFEYHPLRFIDHREQARIRKQRKGRHPTRVHDIGQRFGMDFGFIRSSSSNFSRTDPKTDRVVESFDG